VQPNEIPGRRNPEESRLPARVNHKTFANGSKHRSCLAHASKFFFKKRLQMEANIIAHAWLTPANFSFFYERPSLPKNIAQ
jgi:hypothetical protein